MRARACSTLGLGAGPGLGDRWAISTPIASGDPVCDPKSAGRGDVRAPRPTGPGAIVVRALGTPAGAQIVLTCGTARSGRPRRGAPRAETIMLQGETVALRWEQRRGMPRHVPRQAAISRPQVPICRSADLIPRMGTRGHLE